ncbi:hypothetical protein [Flavivirga spongiicola]|uniref:DUF4625 domain-containing protein n=1 Tax=Flavivirga spongiicola TaxID=421621 RepID=A0ABU7Y1T3_9FLAO|nr:hypothetical protein [Flavivirga sp. MEBiC05379]MDO5981094.1 hypothetical protein [Flavivirga sp. MEBiC05379]
MTKILKLQNIGIILFSVFFMMSCDSDEENNQTPTEVNIEEAKLSGFPLFGIQHTGIEIVQPVITDNKEVTYGEIKITVPSTTSLDNVNVLITSEELNLSKFSISPGNNDAGLSFEDEKIHVYTISTATGSKEVLLHYNVSIIKEVPEVPETLKITGFTFEKSKNPSLSADVTIARIIEEVGRDKIYVFVPLGTDFTDLVPTITYDGTKLYYTQDSSSTSTTEYPAADTSFDFAYPKSFILSVKDKNNDKFRSASVIVDVINPVKIETTSITTPDTKEGDSGSFIVTKWINQGNHILEYQKATTYEDISPVITPPTNVITALRFLPGGGLIPGASADVKVHVNLGLNNFPEGTYKSTAVFYSKIKYNADVSDLLEPAKLTITSKIVK